MATYRIDDLAQTAGTTVRNVRHYQDQGVLPPPRRQGRIGLYDDSHLARLRLIGQLQERGYQLVAIAEMLSAWERGHDLGDLLGLEKVLTDPWTDELPTYLTGPELLQRFAPCLKPAELSEVMAKAQQFGFAELEGDRFRIPSLRLLHVGAELVAAGVPLSAVFEITAQIRADCDRIAGRFIQLTTDHVGLDDRAHRARRQDLAEVTAFIQRLRPLARQATHELLAQSMQTQIQAKLSNQLEAIARMRAAQTPNAQTAEQPQVTR